MEGALDVVDINAALEEGDDEDQLDNLEENDQLF